jgi:hypothetical protein
VVGVSAPNLDWEALFWETQGFLDLDELGDPVPRDELRKTTEANGWTTREFEHALRETDAVEAVGDPLADNPDLRLVIDDTDDTASADTADTEQSDPDDTKTIVEETPSDPAPYADVDWHDLDHDVDPEGCHEYDAWMPAHDKKPWNPGATTENQWSWSNPENWTTAEKTREWFEMHPEVNGRAFILQGDGDEENYNGEPDPFLFVDYDDAADGDGTEPSAAAQDLMNRLGFTYTDYSTSGKGNHQIFRGELPDDVRTIQFEFDDGSEVEIYDQRRVCIMTGKHVADTPVTPQPVNEDVLDDLADEHGKSQATVNREEWEPEFDREDLAGMDETDNIQAIFDAIRQVEPRDIRLRSDLTEERPDGTLSFDPTWASSESGKRLGWDPDIGFIYRKGDVGLDAMQVVALEERIIRSETDYPTGEDWWDAVDALRDRGARIPEYESSSPRDDEDLPPLLDDALDSDEDVESQPVSSLPVGQLEHLSHAERKRAAKKRGLDWPSTREARDQLFGTITEVMRNEDTAVVDAPTSLGKTHTVATTAWNSDPSLDGVSGGAPVIHLQATRDARDEAIEAAAEADIDYFVLQSRHEACPVVAGDYDPPEDDAEDLDYVPITMEGMAASEWIQMMCEGRGIPFSYAHRRLEDHNDQGADLPCCSGDTTYDEDDGDFEETPSECPAIKQWETYREKRKHENLDAVFATHNFAHVPGLRMATNLVIDEEPDFVQDMDKQRVEEAITAYLQAIDAPVTNWEAFIMLSQHDDYQGDAARERDALRDALDEEPPTEHYFEDPRAHTMAPALARAIFHAEDRGNGRRFGKTAYEPPRLDAGASEEDGWNREWVSVVLTEDNELRTVRCAPDFSQARSLVGLDAHPARPKWMTDVHPSIHVKQVLDSHERQLWRRFERGLRVVQVGDATRPLASGEYFNEQQVRTLVEHLADEYGHQFRTAITTNAVESRTKQLMRDAGYVEPETMHYGEEKSRNDFAHERVGLVNGCIDPGDDFVLDLLAELDLDAEPETTVDDDGNEHRAHGRGFDGEDAEVAKEILASVRENHTAQAAGRYARDPSDPDSHATVFVRTDAMPTGFADVQVSGVEWVYTQTQRELVEELREATGTVTAREVADEVDCSKEHVRTTFARLQERDLLQAFEGGGPNGATLYADDGTPNAGMVDVQPSTTNNDVWGSYTASLAIQDPVTPESVADESSSGQTDGRTEVWDWQSTSDPPS